MSEYKITLLSVDKIRPTEETNFRHVNSLANAIQISGVWTHPLLVDDAVYALMDGHHRHRAAQQIGLRTVPVALLSYDDQRVQLEAWRPGESYTPEDLRKTAEAGALLPPKSTRHVVDMPLPRCHVPLDALMNAAVCGSDVDTGTLQPTRAQLLTPFYHALGREIGLRTIAAESVDVETAETQAPHMHLRQMLQVDPAMAALLPAASGRIALGGVDHAPFYLRTTGLILLPPTLLDDPAALAIATRWGLEASHAMKQAPVSMRWLTAVLRHGAALVAAAPPSARDLLLDILPEEIGRELWKDRGRRPSSALLAWQAGRIEGAAAPDPAEARDEAPAVALEAPVERLLVAGGDSRLEVEASTGFNRYGVPPRPRPEAVHFSSSTATAVSDYGFMFSDILRRDLLTSVLQDGADETELRRRAANATGRALCALLGLAEDSADIAIAPSGTDVELLTVMLALAGADERPLTNLLISPAETGRGVKFAAAGRYFDDISATGAPIEKDRPVWPAADIGIRKVAIRDANGAPREAEDLDSEFMSAGREALDAGRHVLAHVLTGSKTGLSAPSYAAVERLVRSSPDHVDVAVDACQMRSEFDEIGALVERGWMVQISGSKFLTGPPFSGALIAPVGLRVRAGGVAALLAAAPGIGRAEDWTAWWARKLPPCVDLGPPSFGPIFRWLPAILEAQLLTRLPRAMRRWAFESFRAAIAKRLAQSLWLQPIDVEAMAARGADTVDDLSRLSIVSFQVFGEERDGSLSPLDEASCRMIFELLNIDAADRLGELSVTERVLARQQAHIGQPVTLTTGQGALTILRMVLGARFFSIIGHAGPGSIEAALESQTSDALRAIGKLELLASRWWRLRDSGGELRTQSHI